MHGKIKQLFMISCVFVPLFFNANAFYFLSRCQTHVHGLHRPFVEKNSRNSPGVSTGFLKNERNTPGSQLFFQKQTRRPRFSIVFHKNEWKHPVVSHIFIKNGREHPVVSSIFSKNRWTRPVVSGIFCSRVLATCCGLATEKKRCHALPRAP